MKSEKAKQYDKEYRLRNKERLRECYRIRYLKNRERILARTSKWQRENKDKVREIEKRRRAKAPIKIKARLKLQQEVRLGRIKRMPCEVCGLENTQAHHHDYTKPLEVRWLCSKHHAELHMTLASH